MLEYRVEPLMTEMTITRDLESYTCDKCGDEVIIPNAPIDGVLFGVCCTCRDVRYTKIYFCYDTHTMVANQDS
ncbi:hypothetical protein N9E35_01370 [Candidatus Marinimicrobia bacterium]|nr:hypothetical protein [Candidatus Neomarinimicrobiota bacterium]